MLLCVMQGCYKRGTWNAISKNGSRLYCDFHKKSQEEENKDVWLSFERIAIWLRKGEEK